MGKTAMAMLAALALIAIASGGIADHQPTQRQASFIGSLFVEHDLNEQCAEAIEEEECITRIPRGIASTFCDGAGHPYALGLYDGIGAVRFCDVPMGSTVTMQYTETDELFHPFGLVYCSLSLPENTGDPWDGFIGYLVDYDPVQFEVPDRCDETGGKEHPGVTHVHVYNIAASLTQQDAFLSVEGKINLSY